ncbi:hypothetical protein [Arthrobacter sp. H14-L1]|uniref:hypothetical protein n=1 Tax=Arthrobacter sp. H14-L1 TaxID=2996697 RepID=UPI00226E86DD|nr:hypothetical protein [Arthrobacter sp. H14-L1]MCY0903529.1 hypothetical protein [Arthrobacter sp. H14-L1]
MVFVASQHAQKFGDGALGRRQIDDVAKVGPPAITGEKFWIQRAVAFDRCGGCLSLRQHFCGALLALAAAVVVPRRLRIPQNMALAALLNLVFLTLEVHTRYVKDVSAKRKPCRNRIRKHG